MTAHLSSVIRRFIGRFFGLQETHDVLEEWRNEATTDEERQKRLELTNQALPDDAAWMKLTLAMHDLLEQNVSITRVDEVLSAFHELAPQAWPLQALVEAMRWRLRSRLTLPPPNANLVGLAEKIETSLCDCLVVVEGDTRSHAMPWETIRQQLLDGVRWTIVGLTNPVLVVRKAELRSLIWCAIRKEFPLLPVFSLRELPRSSRTGLTAIVIAI
jgi:flagellar biosynthesis component FlhA